MYGGAHCRRSISEIFRLGRIIPLTNSDNGVSERLETKSVVYNSSE